MICFQTPQTFAASTTRSGPNATASFGGGKMKRMCGTTRSARDAAARCALLAITERAEGGGGQVERALARLTVAAPLAVALRAHPRAFGDGDLRARGSGRLHTPELDAVYRASRNCMKGRL